jgi:hypothetical protein
MNRSLVTAAAGLAGIGVLSLMPLACGVSGIGDPCTPEDEFSPVFAGFKVSEENIESRSFQCQSRLCLVNHFQGRASCPLGQPPPVNCGSDSDCAGTEVDGVKAVCVPAPTPAVSCDPAADPSDPLHPGIACAGTGGACDEKGKFCTCISTCPDPSQQCVEVVPGGAKACTSKVCHVPGLCQNGEGTPETNSYATPAGVRKEKDCCLPGTDTPVAAPVCGQCSARAADDAVYCSCRCGPPEGKEEDPEYANFNYCACPGGFECKELRPDVGLGDKNLTGKYCVRSDTFYDPEDPATQDCGTVSGYFNSLQCRGIPVPLPL